MELRHLRYFVAVAEEGNVTRAAEKLGIGQPPLSQQILAFERELGVQLFHRTGHGVVATEAGRVLLVDAKRLLEDAQHAILNAQRAGRGETGHLNLGFTASAAFHPTVRSLIRAYRGAYPGVGLTLSEGSTAQLLAMLEEGRMDLAFLRPGRHSFAGMTLHEVAEEALKAVLPRHHPLAKRRRIPLSGLSEESFVLIPREASPMLHDEIVGACRQAGFEPLAGQQAPQLSSVVSLVAAGFGVSLVPASVSQFHAEGVAYVEIQDANARSKLALASRLANGSAKVSNFLTIARQQRGEPATAPTTPI